MGQFYAEIQGNRGSATRMGSKSSGMWAHIRGWSTGVKIYISHVNGQDVISIEKTGGSNRPYGELIATIHEDKGLTIVK